MGMTLDEAIKHAEEVAERYRALEEESKLQECDNYARKCAKCAAEYKRLVLWLKELQAYRKAWERIPLEIKEEQDNVVDPISFCTFGRSLAIIKKNLDELMGEFGK